MNLQQQFHRIRQQLGSRYSEREAGIIADMVLEKVTGYDRGQRISRQSQTLSIPQEQLLEQYLHSLLNGVPVQYVLEEAWFFGRRFSVNKNVLIPRPETEELVQWMLDTIKAEYRERPLRVMDIGTGSGCIPVSLKLEAPWLEVHSLDVSEAALEVARLNARALDAEVIFHRGDFTDNAQWEPFHGFDLIISNPPYIPLGEKQEMEEHVVEQEPHLALFVPDNDPFLFYRLLAAFASQKLVQGGKIFIEIHASAGENVCQLLRQTGFSGIELRKDLQDRDRMIRAEKTVVY